MDYNNVEYTVREVQRVLPQGRVGYSNVYYVREKQYRVNESETE